MPAHDKFAALSEFLRGYLHQDVVAEYGSPEEAVRRFRADADAAQLHRLQTDWRSFLQHCQGKTLAEINSLLTGALGSSWAFTSDDDLRRFSELLLQPSTRPRN